MGVANDDWSLVLNWCLAAAQHNDKEETFVECAVDTFTKGDNDYLK